MKLSLVTPSSSFIISQSENCAPSDHIPCGPPPPGFFKMLSCNPLWGRELLRTMCHLISSRGLAVNLSLLQTPFHFLGLTVCQAHELAWTPWRDTRKLRNSSKGPHHRHHTQLETGGHWGWRASLTGGCREEQNKVSVRHTGLSHILLHACL